VITNVEFLTTVFGADAVNAHVTGFPEDPNNIPKDRHLACWMGGRADQYPIAPGTNQYFTISTFNPDQDGKPRRRKSLYRYTHVIVADDVKEKLPEETVRLLPEPTYKLQTSPGSEQWGWVLQQPATDRHRVENLLDGLVDRGLAPDGKDPGMKGVTRYVRLPGGVNSKASKLVNGLPVPCQMLDWHPSRKFTLEQLAAPFGIKLDEVRRESRVDGAADVSGHPLLQVPEIIIKEKRSDGRFDITCPWVEEHTDGVDDGAAVFTNADGSFGFKCHHGACQSRTGKNLLRHIEGTHPGFTGKLKHWQTMRVLATIPGAGPDFLNGHAATPPVAPPPPDSPAPPNFLGAPPPNFIDPPAPDQSGPEALLQALTGHRPDSPEAEALSSEMLKLVDDMGFIQKNNWHGKVRDHMGWTKSDLNKAITDERAKWYADSVGGDHDFYKEMVFVTEQNAFFNPITRNWLSPDGYQNKYCNRDSSARIEALENERVTRVDRVDFFPGQPHIFLHRGVTRVNMWRGLDDEGVQGDVERWLKHFTILGWDDHKDHILKWLAFTLKHPEFKINHALLFGGGEGCGKDWLLYPLHKAFGDAAITMSGESLLSQFHDQIPGRKYIHFNEVMHGDRRDTVHISNKIKPLLTAPPHELTINPKGLKPYMIRNIVNVTMTSNSATPLNISGDSRRFYAVWTYMNMRDENKQVLPEWRPYWRENWKWMRDDGGWRAVVHYLMTQVDLSEFDPGESPFVTDHLKEIQEASEDPLVTQLRALIDSRYNIFKADLLSASDICTHVNSVEQSSDHRRDHKYTPAIIGKVLKQANMVRPHKVSVSGRQLRILSIRNHQKYAHKSGKELGDLYIQQLAKARGGSPVEAVK